MNQLLLHPTTAHQFKALLEAQPHAILISGGAGTGKRTIAEQFVTEILGAAAPTNNPHLLVISPQANSIGVEDIRKIKSFLHRKTAGTATIRRVIVIDSAHTMTSEAQNALLKTLEEPPADTMVILTVHDPTALKQTIRSRSQQLLVLPVSQRAAEEYFKATGHPLKAIQTAYYMSDGRAGLLKALLEGADEHELVAAITEAKNVLKMPTYERLLKIDELSKQKDQLHLLLQGVERVVLSGLRLAADKNNAAVVKKFYELSKCTQQAQEALSKNGNTKAILTDLFLRM